jgi:hypothetical protein
MRGRLLRRLGSRRCEVRVGVRQHRRSDPASFHGLLQSNLPPQPSGVSGTRASEIAENLPSGSGLRRLQEPNRGPTPICCRSEARCAEDANPRHRNPPDGREATWRGRGLQRRQRIGRNPRCWCGSPGNPLSGAEEEAPPARRACGVGNRSWKRRGIDRRSPTRRPPSRVVPGVFESESDLLVGIPDQVGGNVVGVVGV